MQQISSVDVENKKILCRNTSETFLHVLSIWETDKEQMLSTLIFQLDSIFSIKLLAESEAVVFWLRMLKEPLCHL